MNSSQILSDKIIDVLNEHIYFTPGEAIIGAVLSVLASVISKYRPDLNVKQIKTMMDDIVNTIPDAQIVNIEFRGETLQ